VPIPAAPDDSSATSAVTSLFRQVHDQLRCELDGLDDNALNWLPTPGANSIVTIVTHLVASEAETFQSVAGVECERDRDTEFVGRRRTIHEVLGLLDGADDLITELEPRIDTGHLNALIPLPTVPAEEVRPGLTWLIGTYGHAREHVGQVLLTRQLGQVTGRQLHDT
jgi:DinB family protein